MTKRSRQLMWQRLIVLDPAAAESLQMQLRKGVTRAISGGYVRPDVALPSSRRLAQQLRVSRSTVLLAYRQLTDEGYLIGHERRGYFVNPAVLSPRPTSQTIERMTSRPGPNWQPRLKFNLAGQRNIHKPSNWQDYPYSFVYGQFDPSMFPIADWRECLRRSQSVAIVRSDSIDYFDRDNEMLVRELCDRVLPRRGIWTSPKNILVTLGVQNALFLVARALVKHESIVGIENPGYPDARNIFSLESESVRLLKVDGHGLEVDADLKDCDYVYVTPSHQSPTTVSMSVDRRLALLEEASRSDFIVIEDDYEAEASYIQSAIPSLKSMDTDERVLYCGSVSKSLAPGLRLGFLVAHEEVIRQIRMLRRLLLRHPPALIQGAVGLFLQLGHYDSHISRINKVYMKRWELMGSALDTHLPGSTIIPKFGGTAFWVRGPEGLDANLLAVECARHGVLIEPGDVHFGEDRPPLNYFRLGFSTIANDRIEEGVRRIAELLKRLR